MANDNEIPQPAQDELTQWEPPNKSFAIIADHLKRYTEKNAADKFFLGGLQKAAETIAYDEPLTTGRGETLHLKPEALELTNFLPSSKAAGSLAGIGAIGLRRMAEVDPALWRTVTALKTKLRQMPSEAWQEQKALIESNPQFFAVPRGRDVLDPEYLKRYPTPVKFGMEVPEAKATSNYPMPGANVPLDELFDSPRHYRAYPDLRNFEVAYDASLGHGAGAMDFSNKRITVGPVSSHQEMLDILNHEVTHAVQRFEGWPYGTNRQKAAQNLAEIAAIDKLGEKLPPVMARQMDLASTLRDAVRPREKIPVTVPNSVAFEEYRRAAGEQLAEAVARSAREGGGRVPLHYDQPTSRMYDPTVMDRAISSMIDALNKSAGLK